MKNGWMFLVAGAVGIGAVVAGAAACGVDEPTELKCEAGQTGPCNLECTEGTCNASCQSPNGNCNLKCTGDSECTCTGNTCNLTCESSKSCNCKASICQCTGANCKR